MSPAYDILRSASIMRHTRRILALQKRERAAAGKLGRIVADIGDELIAAKADLDNSNDKTAWGRWIKKHVHYTHQTATAYMRVARLRKKMKNVFQNLQHLHISCLYRVASLPDEIIEKLTPDTELADPKTGKKKRIADMSARELDRALDALEGIRKKPEKLIDTQHAIDCDVILDGAATREAFAAAARQHLESFTRRLRETDLRKLSGKLRPESKQAFLDAVESARRAALKWPAWSPRRNPTPATP